MLTRDQWLEARKKSIGGSDASAILGLNPYKTNVELWELKTGRREEPDIGDKPFVKYGNDAERHLIDLFFLDFPEYESGDRSQPGYLLHRHPKHDFITGTLDAGMTEKATGRRGILEIKTTNILQSMHAEKWRDGVPQNYYVQCLHYLLVTGCDFCVLKAQLKRVYGGDVRLDTRHYFIERKDVLSDLEHLEKKEVEFWNEYVLKDVRPPLVLPSI
ncbi:lambda-exonuclease family protein [Polynucleobacter sp.]|uniref:lambda-exonuclease family protein n=1 Tax=Polynucleobacter sp. TaxID=2029855 RepID=UPI003F69A3B1